MVICSVLILIIASIGMSRRAGMSQGYTGSIPIDRDWPNVIAEGCAFRPQNGLRRPHPYPRRP